MKHAAAVPLRPLLLLATAVSAVHLLLLGAAPGPLHVATPAAAQPFITRSIPVGPGPAPTAAKPPRPSKPLPAIVARREAKSAREVKDALRIAPAPAAQETVTAPAVPMGMAPAPTALTGTIETSAPSVRFTVAGSMQLRYQVTAHGRGLALAGEGRLAWRHDGESYEARLEVSAPLPARTQRSTGRITAEGLEPMRFSEKTRTEAAAHFQRDAGKVSFSSNKSDALLFAGAQDRLSVLLQLGAMLAGQPGKFPPGTAITIQTAGTRDAEPWVFTVEQEEPLDLPGGTVSALKLTRTPRKEFDQKVEVWLAPGMDYVPVRLRLTQPNGESVNYEWSSTDKG